MSSDLTDNAVTEYLRELELRLTGLPVLQRRELLADLRAHITNERAERGASTESDVLDILERLGSPEVVAAAAYEEAGLFTPREPVLSHAGSRAASGALPAVAPPPDSPPPAYAGPFPPQSGFGGPADFGQAFAGPSPAPAVRPKPDGSTGLRVVVGLAIAAVVVMVLGCLAGAVFLAQGSSAGPASGTSTVERAPDERPGITDPLPAEPAEPAPPVPTVD